ncbi:5-guanidino-2-oxopentanoate decarboxylase [Sporohalobacter salinus]|uniref:5-guanidino-2-oxopentanoate decarboxylase n=1 Tax=Sporohalobacter salinus TaxID=1494606 RepID=UPI0019606357|nr:thiamine pyrophosphate-dependent acetolactate synthase large subunit-like protein [Sporohalobacter salinus]
MAKKSEQVGADLVVKSLEDLQVETVFGIPGIHNLDIYDSLISSNVEHVTARHEQGAGFMADGYARTNGKPGVCLVISGPGLTNIITPMGQAMADSVPMVVISSQLPTSDLGQGTGFLHEIKNSTYLTKSVAKKSKRVMHKDKIGASIKEAYHLSMTGRPGPVHVEVPLDVLQTPISNKQLSINNNSISYNPWEDLNQDDKIDSTVNLLQKADKPIIIAGGGSSQSTEELKKLVERLKAPVVQTVAGKGVISEKHPLCLGASIKFNSIQKRIKNSDCVLAVGTELAPTDLESTDLKIEGTLIQIDIDPGNFQRNFPADISLRGNALQMLSKINDKLNLKGIDNNKLQVEQIRYSKEELISHRRVKESELDFTLNVLEVIREVISDDGILVADMTSPAYVARSEYPAHKPQTFLHPIGYGTLGYALPAAVGAKFADPKKEIVALAGDGGFQFTMQELGVLLEYEFTLPIIIWNNGGFGEIRKNEKMRHPGETIAVNHKNPNLKDLARSYEFSFSSVSKSSELKLALEGALTKYKSEIIEIDVNKREG